jgi:hypothetical protein
MPLTDAFANEDDQSRREHPPPAPRIRKPDRALAQKGLAFRSEGNVYVGHGRLMRPPKKPFAPTIAWTGLASVRPGIGPPLTTEGLKMSLTLTTKQRELLILRNNASC